MQLSPVAQTLKISVQHEKMNSNIIEIVERFEKGIHSKRIWRSLVKESGNDLPRAMVLSRLEFLVSIGKITYANRKTENGVIRDYRVL